MAEIVGEYLRKGAKVFIEGRLRTTKWQDKNTGQDRYTTEIVADNMQMLDSKGGGSATESAAFTKPATSSTGTAEAAPPLDQFDDDIPF